MESHTAEMLKTDAIALFKSATDLAKATGQSKQTICQWPDLLKPRQLDLVAAALWRRRQGLPDPVRESRSEEAA